jgi:hypothetical protein
LLLGDDWGSLPVIPPAGGLLLCIGLASLALPSCNPPAQVQKGEYEILRGAPGRAFDVRRQGELIGLAQRYEADGLPGRGWTVVQNPYGQDLGLLDEHGRAWRYRPFGAEPELLGTFDTAEGIARLLGVGQAGLEVVERARAGD